jgi:hypothetical protein
LNWANYDYRAITAGAALVLLAAIAFWVNPLSVVDCRRDVNQCEVSETSGFSRSVRGVPLPNVQHARSECERTGRTGECEYAVLLEGKGLREKVMGGLRSSSDAAGIETQINRFLADAGIPGVRVSRHADRTWGYVLLGVGAAFVALGIRKNLVDRGY